MDGEAYKQLERERARIQVAVGGARALVASWMPAGADADSDDEPLALADGVRGLGSSKARAAPALPRNEALEKLRRQTPSRGRDEASGKEPTGRARPGQPPAAAGRVAKGSHKPSSAGPRPLPAAAGSSDDEEEVRPARKKQATSALDAYRKTKRRR